VEWSSLSPLREPSLGDTHWVAGDVRLRARQGPCMPASTESEKPYCFLKGKVFDFSHLLQIKDNEVGLIPWSVGS